MGWCPDVPALRLVAPGATWVDVICRDHPAGQQQQTLPMTRVVAGERIYWEYCGLLPLPYYRFLVHRPHGTLEIADPWSTAVVRQKLPGHPAWSFARRHGDLDDEPPEPPVVLDPEDAVIIELHVGDQTGHPSAGAQVPGTYEALSERGRGRRAAIDQLLDLGANAVELLPVTSWPVIEGETVNHWGYMPSFLCAPSERYMPGWEEAPAGSWPGVDSRGWFRDPGRALRRLVRGLHDNGVAVILDLVYNHVSAHDGNPLLLLDPGDWFHREPDGQRRSASGCGNDLNTAHPEMRALVLHSFRHWLVDYHVDGVRLDLAELIDDETLRRMIEIAAEVRPGALMIAEPWSLMGHRPAEIAAMGYTVWNDRCRNAIKGRDPLHDRGFATGEPSGDPRALRREIEIVLGGCAAAAGGHLPAAARSLNYIESHDDGTFGDFVRLAIGEVVPGEPVLRSEAALVRGRALRVHRLAAALLLSCRGPVMLAQGQCWGRAKVAPELGADHGPLCANTYDRPDSTNLIDWGERDRNAELVQWYRQLIAWRRHHLMPAFRAGATQHFLHADRDLCVGYTVTASSAQWAVLFNAERVHPANFEVEGQGWTVHLGSATVTPREAGRSRIFVRQASVAVLRRDPEIVPRR